MSKVWIVVADEAKARILATDTASEPLIEYDELVSLKATLSEKDLVSDKPGRSFDSSGERRHTMAQRTNPKEHISIGFAKELADYLEKNRQNNSFVKLLIIAAPHFLGLLRKELSKGVSDIVSLEIDKNLTIESAKSIREHLPQYF